MAKTATKKKTKKTTTNKLEPGKPDPLLTSPDLPAIPSGNGAGAGAALGLVQGAVIGAHALSRTLSGAGLKPEVVGGSLPQIKLERPGQGFMAIFRGVRQPEGLEFGLSVWDLLDPQKFVEDPKNPAAAVLQRAEMVLSTAILDWCVEESNVGRTVTVVFTGTQPTKRGQSDLKCMTISEVTKA